MVRMQLAYPFSADHSQSSDELTAMLGGKGAGLAAMTAAGLPVPPGFTLVTAACRAFLADGWTDDLERAIDTGVAELERQTGKRLGAADSPLLVSVRSGAAVSMPGMMDTVLNVGMNVDVERALADLSGDQAFAADTRTRALLSFAEIVLGADADDLNLASAGSSPIDVAEILRRAGYEVTPDPLAQIKAAVRTVFESWRSPRAVRYREIEGIDSTIGTAVTIQSMVFGNLGSTSGTGVAFSRNPTSGARGIMGDFLDQAQGEDVVAGGRLTRPLHDMGASWPEVFSQLAGIADVLENRYRDMVDIEFTVEQGRLWMLQARRGKRSPIAAFRMAIDMANDLEFPVDRAEAVARCRRYLDDPPTIISESDDGELPVIAEGIGASPGQASGVLCLDPDSAVELEAKGIGLILARRETSPSDIHGMAAAKGLFTTLGGQVSHAALVAREWGLPAVVGAAEAEIVDGALEGPGGRVEAGTVVTVDGGRGRLLLGRSSARGEVAPEVETIERWASELDGSEQADADPVSAEVRTGATEPSASPEVASRDGGDGSPDLAFRAFHALRIKGMVTADVVAAMCGCSEDGAVGALNRLVDQGSANFMEPRSMWVITPDGRTAHQPELAQAVEPLDLTALPYERFLVLNDDFKQLCTDWQVRDGEPNDHADEAYDADIRARLGAHDDLSQPVVIAIGERVPWMATYPARLTAARERMQSGDPKALTGVMCDSYHDIWMELHEDLILTQGIDRAAEGST